MFAGHIMSLYGQHYFCTHMNISVFGKVINDNLQALTGLIFLYISREVKVT